MPYSMHDGATVLPNMIWEKEMSEREIEALLRH